MENSVLEKRISINIDLEEDSKYIPIDFLSNITESCNKLLRNKLNKNFAKRVFAHVTMIFVRENDIDTPSGINITIVSTNSTKSLDDLYSNYLANEIEGYARKCINAIKNINKTIESLSSHFDCLIKLND